MLHGPGGRAPFRQGVLPPGEGQDRTTEGAEQLFPEVTLDGWREGLFQLCWQQHGGSGLVAPLGHALELATTDRDWLLDRINEQRTREARAMEKAARSKKGGR